MLENIPDVVLQLLAFLLIGVILFILESTILSRRSRETGAQTTTTGELARLASDLDRTSGELDNILAEIVEVARGRAEATTKLQQEINRLEQAEEEYLIRIETLKNEPVRVIGDLLNELKPNQIRTPRRDVLLFLAGGAVSAMVSVVFGLLR